MDRTLSQSLTEFLRKQRWGGAALEETQSDGWGCESALYRRLVWASGSWA